MEHYNIEIGGVKRALPLCPVTDDLYIGAFITLGDPELATACACELIKKAPEYDYIITIETKGIPIVHEMTRLDNRDRYILVFKAPQIYMTGVFSVDVRSITTAKEQHIYIDSADAELIKGKRILIVDDIISTGESVASLERLVTAAGGIVAGKMFVLAEGEAAQRDDIIYLQHLPMFDADGKPYSK